LSPDQLIQQIANYCQYTYDTHRKNERIFKGGEKKVVGFGVVEDVDTELPEQRPRVDYTHRRYLKVQKAASDGGVFTKELSNRTEKVEAVVMTGAASHVVGFFLRHVAPLPLPPDEIV
jgi:hypothetical protein